MGLKKTETIITSLSPSEWLESKKGEMEAVLRSGGIFYGELPAIIYIKELSEDSQITLGEK